MFSFVQTPLCNLSGDGDWLIMAWVVGRCGLLGRGIWSTKWEPLLRRSCMGPLLLLLQDGQGKVVNGSMPDVQGTRFQTPRILRNHPWLLCTSLKTGKADGLRRRSKALNMRLSQETYLQPTPTLTQLSLWIYYHQTIFAQLLTLLKCLAVMTQLMTTHLWRSQLVHTLWPLKGSAEAYFLKEEPRNASCLSSMLQTQLSGPGDLVLLSALYLKCEQLEVRKGKRKGEASSSKWCRSLSSTVITRGCHRRFSTHLQTYLI